MDKTKITYCSNKYLMEEEPIMCKRNLRLLISLCTLMTFVFAQDSTNVTITLQPNGNLDYSSDSDIYGFDLWVENYIGIDNPGPDYVEKQLRDFGHKGKIEFISGDSKKTIPKFFKEKPDLYFDLITVDGDHRIKGAKIDIRNVVKRLKVGGMLVFDDVSSPHHPYLNNLWKKEIVSNPRYFSYEYEDVGLGIGIAVKRY